MPIQHTTEFVATSEESIQTIAEDLATSHRKWKVFQAVYSGGNVPKTAADLELKTGLSQVAVLQLATPMAHKQYFEQVKYEGRVAFRKYKHINAVKQKILRLAKNPRRLEHHVSARTPRATVDVRVRVGERNEIRVREVFIDDIDNFKPVRKVSFTNIKPLTPTQLPERVFKYAIASILGNKGKFQDWGGEKNDLYTSHASINGTRKSTAFAFKGSATSPPLTPKKLGKNADQIQRLFSSTAEVFLIQFEGKIEESVKEQMMALAVKKSRDTRREIFYGVIALEDSHRLRTAFPTEFAQTDS